MVGLSGLVMAGGYVDAWAHNHFVLETFFTPWHGLLYTSLAATLLFLLATAASTGAPPWRWLRALPDGYGLSLVGGLLFGLAGLLDLGWHSIFGIERSFAQLLSPTHLLLMLSAGLLVSGPLRADWRRPGRRPGYPAVLAATLVLSVLTFFGQFDHPLTSLWAGPDQIPGESWAAEQLGVLGVMMQTAAFMGVILALVARFDLPVGSLTLVLGLDSVAVTLIQSASPILLTGFAAGLMADGLLILLRPGRDRPFQFHLFACLVPAVTYAIYFAWLLATRGIWWPVPIWTAAIVAAALIGWLLSLLVLQSSGSRLKLGQRPGEG